MTAAQDSRSLKPCPFCGGRAEFDEHDEECYFTKLRGLKQSKDAADMAPIMELIPAWNRRAALPAEPVARTPLSDEQRASMFDDLFPHGADKGIRKLFSSVVSSTERAHGITQEKQG